MRRFTLTAVAGLMITAAVQSQTPTYSQRPAPPPALLTPGTHGVNSIFADIHRQNLSERARQAVANTSPGRLNRADRAAALINAGDCPGALALALNERDRRLASRIAEVCETPN